MKRALLLVTVLVAGFSVGAGLVLAVQRPDATDAGDRAGSADSERDSGASSPSPSASPEPTPKTAPTPQPGEGLLLAWTSGGLPDGFADALSDLSAVERTTVVGGGLWELERSVDAEGQPADDLGGDWVIPLDVVALDTETYPGFVSKAAAPAISELGAGEALLSETGASLRGLGEGARLETRDGPELEVVGIVDDAQLAGAEVAVADETAEGTAAGVPRHVLLTYRGDRAEVEPAIRALLADGPPVRLRGPGESPVLRHGDAVLTQAQVKQRFGEFAYRRGEGVEIEQDADWTRANVETAELPILGPVRCHRAILPALEGALAELEREHLAHTIDPDGFRGCHNPRLTRSGDSVSRHAWGIALDLNVPDNPQGQESAQDERLVEVLERWGLAWGGPWLVPDPAHFEYLRPPAPGTE